MTSSDKYIISLSLNGKLNVWNLETLEDQKLPDQVFNGHQNYVSKVIYNKEAGTVISSDYNGKILQWDSNRNASVVHNLHSVKVISIALSSDNKILYSLGFDLTLIGFDLTTSSKLFDTKIKNGEVQSLQASRSDPQTVYILQNNSLLTINNGKQVSDNSFSFDARSFAVSDSEIYVGDRVIL